jgi:hypothetical protein
MFKWCWKTRSYIFSISEKTAYKPEYISILSRRLAKCGRARRVRPTATFFVLATSEREYCRGGRGGVCDRPASPVVPLIKYDSIR